IDFTFLVGVYCGYRIFGMIVLKCIDHILPFPYQTIDIMLVV
ncbi:unnamed protein product, partial [marine sediment metagenome]